MRRIILVALFALVIGGGAVVTAQTLPETQREEADAGVPLAGCGTPVSSPIASPELEEVAEVVATAIASPDASPAVLGVDPCATPELATPGS